MLELTESYIYSFLHVIAKSLYESNGPESSNGRGFWEM